MPLPCSFTVLIMLWYTAAIPLPRHFRSAGVLPFGGKGRTARSARLFEIG